MRPSASAFCVMVLVYVPPSSRRDWRSYGIDALVDMVAIMSAFAVVYGAYIVSSAMLLRSFPRPFYPGAYILKVPSCSWKIFSRPFSHPLTIDPCVLICTATLSPLASTPFRILLFYTSPQGWTKSRASMWCITSRSVAFSSPSIALAASPFSSSATTKG